MKHLYKLIGYNNHLTHKLQLEIPLVHLVVHPGALSIRPNILEIPGGGTTVTDVFPEFHFEMLGVPREAALKFRKIEITG